MDYAQDTGSLLPRRNGAFESAGGVGYILNLHGDGGKGEGYSDTSRRSLGDHRPGGEGGLPPCGGAHGEAWGSGGADRKGAAGDLQCWCRGARGHGMEEVGVVEGGGIVGNHRVGGGDEISGWMNE